MGSFWENLAARCVTVSLCNFPPVDTFQTEQGHLGRSHLRLAL